MGDSFSWVVGLLALTLSVVGIWLTIVYGEQSKGLLQRICRSLGLEGSGNPLQ
jgi:hypothetical protein